MPTKTGHSIHPPSVVGIGASAGGIEAIQALFAALPSDLGHAYVVVVHLAPDHPSELGRIIERTTKMKVTEMRDDLVDLLGEGAVDGMIGVLCQLPSQAVFVKIQGPSDEVRANEAAFRAFCASLEQP
jgi:hypothetical protein